eukprot:1868591-Rhodomonas_salina.1
MMWSTERCSSVAFLRGNRLAALRLVPGGVAATCFVAVYGRTLSARLVDRGGFAVRRARVTEG